MAAKKKTTALAKWDAAMAAAAEASLDTVADLGGLGNFFSLQGGTLKLAGDAVPNNEMVCIVLDHVLENGYNDTDYDPDNPASPVCYAFGRKTDDMVPFDGCDNPQSEKCTGCPLNEWGSADKGKGKACKNRARLALIPGGAIIDGRFEPEVEPENITGEPVAYLKVPPTSIGAWGAYVKGIAKAPLKRPPWAVYTKVSVVPDDKNQIAVQFEMLGTCEADIGEALIARVEAQAEETCFGYPKNEEEAPKKGKRKVAKKKTGKVKRRKF